jgi:ubiquinone/menaquinone biosynthesis C-methylase UbiE
MRNRTYWNLRAKKNKHTIKSTTNFNLIKEFEISILKYLIKKYLKKKKLKILELGCGNGINIKRLKKIFPKFEFLGIDYSPEMIRYAKKNSNSNVNFIEADITNKDIYNKLPKFDLIFTNRCLINLKSDNKIKLAINKSKKLLKRNGYFIFLENFSNGHKNKNKLRKILGLKFRKIAKFNKFLNQKLFLNFLKRNFRILENINYSSLNDLLLYVLLPNKSGKINYNSKLQKKLIFLLIKVLEKEKTLLTLNYNSGQNNLIVCKK